MGGLGPGSNKKNYSEESDSSFQMKIGSISERRGHNCYER